MASIGEDVNSLSCPTASLCVGVAVGGEILTSTNPASGPWQLIHVSSVIGPSDPGTGQAYPPDLTGVSCPSTSLCVAAAYDQLVTSTDPTGGTPAWDVQGTNKFNIESVTCASESLCVGGDGIGDLVTSTDPAGGVSTWSGQVGIDYLRDLDQISCPTNTYCVAGDNAGYVATSTDPTGGVSAWPLSDALPGTNSLSALSCSSTRLCVAIDPAGRMISSNDPAASQPTWNVPAATTLTNDYQFHLSCPTRSLCVGMGIPNPDCIPNCAFPDDTVATSTSPGSGPGTWRVSPSQVLSEIDGLSCSSSKECVAVSYGDKLFASNHPAIAGSWRSTDHVQNSGATDVSCAAQPLCVATAGAYVLTSTEPAGGSEQWKRTHVDRAPPLDETSGTQASLSSVSCTSGMLCAAADNGGDVVTSINPTGGARAWTTQNLNLGYPLSQIQCPSIQLCVAIGGQDGDVVWSTDPTGPATTWHVTTIDPGNIVTSLSCPSAKLCVVGDQNGNVIVGTGQGPRGVARKPALNDLTQALGQSCVHEQFIRIRRRGGCPTPFTAPGAGLVTISWLGPRGGVLATTRVVTTAHRRLILHVTLTTNGKRTLRRAEATEVRMRATFEDAAGHLYTRTAKITLTP